MQWLYFGYLAGIKEQNGAAMSLGRTSTFLDIYFERDLKAGVLTESEAQEIMDDFVLHLRMARHLRTPEYNELFGGDPMWITEAVGGIGEDGRHMVTKNSYRMLNTLYNLNPAAEPNLTVLWSEQLPENWKKFIAKTSIDTDALQYENDDVMRPCTRRRLRNRVLCFRDARGQGHAVLRRARQHRKADDDGDQRRPRREQVRAGRPGDASHGGRCARLR